MMAAPDNRSPSAFKLQNSELQNSESPLDTLVRRTSARSARTAAASRANPPSRFPIQTHQSSDHYAQAPHSYSAPNQMHGLEVTPPRQPYRHDLATPASPLLHSHFARDSTATYSSNDNNSYLDRTRTSIDSRNVYQQDLEYRYYDDESVYSTDPSVTPAIRDSWQSGTSAGTLRPGNEQHQQIKGQWSNPNAMPSYIQEEPSSPASPDSPVPTVVVSSPDTHLNPEYTSRAGRAPIVRPTTSNFSRPVRAPNQEAAPPDDEQKRRVLERNMQRTTSPNVTEHSPYPHNNRPSPRSPQFSPYQGDYVVSNQATPDHHFQQAMSPTPSPRSDRAKSPGLSPYSTQSPQTSPLPDYSALSSPQTPASGTLSRNLTLSMPDIKSPVLSPGAVSLPRGPPSLRAGSPASLYSSYSFYQYDSATPSPTVTDFNSKAPPAFAPPTVQKRSQLPPQLIVTPPLSPLSQSDNQTAQDFLQLGIQHHEANRLKESAVCFEKSAKEGGGCGVGMLMWGLALRHGWGCEKNEKYGFKWLRRAAESAVGDLESARTHGGADPTTVQSELVLAIYEVGQCFFQGWGVAKDQKMAVSYYTVAAKLGDPDAQSDLAFCLANGKGCKRDKKQAAKWYRDAVAQGQSDIGLAWIYKEKYK